MKGRSAREINLATGRIGALWQKGFHDHAVRSDESLQALAAYVIENPVRAELVKRASDYSLWHSIWEFDPSDERMTSG